MSFIKSAFELSFVMVGCWLPQHFFFVDDLSLFVAKRKNDLCHDVEGPHPGKHDTVALTNVSIESSVQLGGVRDRVDCSAAF
jgi:hypothetical protein